MYLEVQVSPVTGSVQAGSVNLSGSATVNKTISSVNLSKAIVISSFWGIQQAYVNTGGYGVRVRLTSATNLEFYCGMGMSGSARYQVIQLDGIKNIQRGIINMNGESTKSASITAVSTSKTIVIFSHEGITLNYDGQTDGVQCYLSASNQVTAYCGVGYRGTVAYQVVEFN